jgi:hypothetical protein
LRVNGRRQGENLQVALKRAESPDPAVAAYVAGPPRPGSVSKMAWLREHADAFRMALAADAARTPD